MFYFDTFYFLDDYVIIISQNYLYVNSLLLNWCNIFYRIRYDWSGVLLFFGNIKYIAYEIK